MPADTAVSVITATRNRLQVVVEAVEHVSRAIAYAEVSAEILVVDASPESSQQLASDERLRYIYRGDIPYSTVTSKNTGFNSARGELPVLIYDDCFVSEGWLARLLAGFGDATVGLVGGRIVYHPWAPIEKSDRVGVLELDRDIVEGSFSRYSNGIIEVAHLAGGNLAVRKELTIAVGGIDPGFVGSANGEETDFVLRGRNLGYRATYDPDAWVEHRAAPRSDGIQRSLTSFVYRYSMVRNRTYFLRKHGALVGLRVSTRRHLVDLAAGSAKLLLGAAVFIVATISGVVAGHAARVPNQGSTAVVPRKRKPT